MVGRKDLQIDYYMQELVSEHSLIPHVLLLYCKGSSQQAEAFTYIESSLSGYERSKKVVVEYMFVLIKV